ncbi:MAG: orotidine-5-phosphate decarboxylase [Actinomycetota bacterium]|jgi:orotidine-5'-phosphate decarboxylase
MPADAEMRSHLAIALDVDDLVEATRIGRELEPWFSVAKVGLELYSASGPDAIVTVSALGYRVFLDLKLHDIPTTVGRAARVLGAVGVSYLTMHAAGGAAMLRAGVEGLRDGAERAGLEPPVALAVTILTSDEHASPELFAERVQAAVEAGCGGLVCAVGDVATAKQLAPDLLAVVPGIRMPGGDVHDQARAGTPAAALAAGADLLVVGRAVTAAPDRGAAAAELVASVGA